MIKVYIAGPYGRRSNASPAAQMQNAYEAIDAAIKLLYRGYNVFVPHIYGFVHNIMEPPLSEETWLEKFLEWVSLCDCVLRLPGDSKGSDIEVDRARQLDIPVFYSIEGIDLWQKGR